MVFLAEFVKVAKEADLKEGEGKVVEANGLQIALFKKGGKFFALDNACLHAGGPIGEGSLDEEEFVMCPWHGWRYNIHNGENDFDETLKLKTYNTKVLGGEVLVEI